MESKPKRIDLLISKDSYDHLELIALSYDIKKGAALEKIIQEYKERNVDQSLSDIKRMAKGTRIVSNKLDQKVDMILNILNSIVLNENHNIYTSPDKVMSRLYEKALEEVKVKKEKEMIKKRK